MILDDIVNDKKRRIKEYKEIVSYVNMKEMALNTTRTCKDFYGALKKPGLSIIGEFKKASPSMGIIKNTIELTDRIEQYNNSVDAISVLTEENHFNGSVDYLKEIRKISELPILRKDFIIDEYQIYEAKVIGADAILLIVAILRDEELKQFYDLASSLSLSCLVEVHDEEEMDRAIKLDAKIIGVNNRNLKTFEISIDTTKRLYKILEDKGIEDKIFISESGINSNEDIVFLKDCNVNGVLIGRAFMESDSPLQLANEWKKIFS